MPFLILDGGMATELERRGAVLDDFLWSAKILAEQPELIRQVHLDYFLAGADVATTSSYQATFEGFARCGLSRKEAEILFRRSVELAREARDIFWDDSANRVGRVRPLVAASVGPYGAFLADGSEYRGDYGLTLSELMDFHRPRMEALIDSNPDLLAFETVPCQLEGEALLRSLEEFPGINAWLSFSCRDEAHVCHGETLSDCASMTGDHPQIVAVGVNCTPPHFVEALLRSARPFTQKPLLCYPNSGEKWDPTHHCWLQDGLPVDFGELAARWYDAGARLIGGCCRTGPEDIARIRVAVGGGQ
jgi:homocysteine S-methyltransferase